MEATLEFMDILTDSPPLDHVVLLQRQIDVLVRPINCLLA